MKRCEKIAFRAMAAVLGPLGVKLRVETGGKHAQVIATAPDGRWCKSPLASTPRADEKSQANFCRQDACRIAREFGLMPPSPDPAADRPKVHHARVKGEPRVRFTREAPLRRDPSRDPWAALAGLRLGAGE